MLRYGSGARFSAVKKKREVINDYSVTHLISGGSMIVLMAPA